MGKKSANIILNIYFLLLFCVFPVLEHDQYSDILTVKSKFFDISTLLMFAALAAAGIVAGIKARSAGGYPQKAMPPRQQASGKASETGGYPQKAMPPRQQASGKASETGGYPQKAVPPRQQASGKASETGGYPQKAVPPWQQVSGKASETPLHGKKSFGRPQTRRRFDKTDWFVLAFMAALTVSLLLTGDKASAFWGTDGRKTGYLVLMLCCGLFFAARKLLRASRAGIVAAAAVAAFISVIALCNHLGFNPLSLCSTVDDVKSQFISTLGNRNCLAAYLSLLLALAIPFFCKTEDKKWRRLTGVLLAVLFLGMLAAMSDSVCLAFAAVMAVTLLFVMPYPEEVRRWSRVCLIWVACMYLFLLLRAACPDSRWKLYGLWKLVLSGKTLAAITAAVLILFVLFLFYRGGRWMRKVRLILFVCLVAAVAAGVAVLIWSTLHKTPDEAEEMFGRLTPYLYFGENWGTNRGIIWRSAASTFANMPLRYQIFGYGPARFKAAYEMYDATFGYLKLDGMLVDAHNEALQYLVTTGVAGVVGYFGIFLSAIVFFFRKYRGNKMAGVVGVTFVTAFFVQGFVNNTHLYIEPIAFMLLGMLMAEGGFTFSARSGKVEQKEG